MLDFSFFISTKLNTFCISTRAKWRKSYKEVNLTKYYNVIVVCVQAVYKVLSSGLRARGCTVLTALKVYSKYMIDGKWGQGTAYCSVIMFLLLFLLLFVYRLCSVQLPEAVLYKLYRCTVYG